MQTTQLTCPHCASILNFGTAINAGTPVECLICMRAFTAVNPVTVKVAAPPPKMPPPNIIKAKPASATEVLIAKPHSSPTAVAASTSALSSFSAPCTRQSAQGPNLALIAGSVAVLVVLIGGIGVALWKVTTITSNFSSGANNPPIAKGELPNDAKEPENGGGDPLNHDPDMDDDIRNKFQEEMKQVLKRKQHSKVEDPSWGLATTTFASHTVTGIDQAMINQVIARGVAYLKNSQQGNGTWNNGHGTGHAALAGLTFLECGVPADDAAIQRAAGFVRSQSAGLRATYELALAVLFLDRLGEPRDQPLIQGMSVRLMAGQNDVGGWTYNCDVLSPQEMYQLFNLLKTNEQLLNPTGAAPKGYALNPVRAADLPLNDPFRQFNQLMLTRGVAVEKTKDDVKASPNSNPKTPPKNPVSPPILADALNPKLKNLPGLQQKGKRKGKGIGFGAGDNSNTQYALLALWAARRHGVPTTQALLLANQRFVASQNKDNGWGYLMQTGSTHTMTCVGLLGLGIGHGTAPEAKPALEDPRIQKGLQALARNIGQPSTDPNRNTFPMENLYFLWSVERVAMLYDLQTIGGKDWYGWGAQLLVHNQRADGAWNQSHYHGANPALNTCFALLFLKRSNLVADLTDNLRLNVGVRETP